MNPDALNKINPREAQVFVNHFNQEKALKRWRVAEDKRF